MSSIPSWFKSRLRERLKKPSEGVGGFSNIHHQSQAASRFGDRRESIGEVRAAAAPDLHALALLAGEDPEAVVLFSKARPGADIAPANDHAASYLFASAVKHSLPRYSGGGGLMFDPK